MISVHIPVYYVHEIRKLKVRNKKDMKKGNESWMIYDITWMRKKVPVIAVSNRLFHDVLS